MNKKYMLAVVSVGIFFCANLNAMLGLQRSSQVGSRALLIAVSGILSGVAACAKREARGATTEGMNAAARQRVSNVPRASFSSVDYSSGRGDALARDLKVLQEDAEARGIDLQFPVRLDHRAGMAYRYNLLKMQELTTETKAEFKQREEWLKEDDKKIAAIRNRFDQETWNEMVTSARKRTEGWKELKMFACSIPVVLCGTVVYAECLNSFCHWWFYGR